MPTIPTGQMERELRALYLRWLAGVSLDGDVNGKVDAFQASSQALIERLGGRTAMLGALGDFPAPRLLDLSPHVGTIYSDMKQAAIQAGISIGLGATDVARQMFNAGMDKSFNRLNRLARTETVSAYWKNAWDSISDLPALVMVWGSEDGPRTCAWCRERDGLVMDSPNLRDHPNGRCTPIPKLRSQVEYRGSISADGRIYMDPRWAKKPEPVAAVSRPEVDPFDQWVATAERFSSEFGGKRITNVLRKAADTSDFSLVEDLYRAGKLPDVQYRAAAQQWAKRTGTPLAPKPVVAPAPVVAPTEPMSRIFKGVTKVQEDELARYTQNSFQMNATLRSGVIPEQVALLDAALHSSTLPRSTRALRVIDDEAGAAALRVARSGGTYTDPAFMSTQKKGFWDVDELVENFAMSGDKPVVMEFDLPAGYHALDIGGKLDDHPLSLGFDQGEVLLPRNAPFRPAKPVDMGDYWLIRMRPA